MNREETDVALRHRFSLTGQRWGPDTTHGWAQALEDIPADDVRRAMTALVRNGQLDITVPLIRSQLRGETRANQARQRPPSPDCACTTRKLCDAHRAVGLSAIADIRRHQGWTAPASPNEPPAYTEQIGLQLLTHLETADRRNR